MAFLASAAQATTFTEAVIVARHEFQGFEFSISSQSGTAFEYFQPFPPVFAWRIANYPTEHVAEFTVVSKQGTRLKVTQKLAAGPDVNAHVAVTEGNGS
ncbi:MAG TPA: hypothetical protein VEK74_09125 [Burkholderiaceae bacterium]|nr:hypothetical protein [Burkholderiaceae bacterium]